jgi:hypothetical protein
MDLLDIIALFVVGVVLAFPLGIVVVVAFAAILIGIDRFTDRCPGFSHFRRWCRRRRYRPGRILSQFLVPDVIRDVEVVDASAIDAGILTVRTRTWNVLYVTKGLSQKPAFGEARTVAFENLWAWSGLGEHSTPEPPRSDRPGDDPLSGDPFE